MRVEALVTGITGTCISAVGTATQTNQTLETISLIVTIVGAVVTCIIMPLLNWYLNAKKDGKITKDEINEAKDTLQKGINDVKNLVDDKTKKEDKKDDSK